MAMHLYAYSGRILAKIHMAHTCMCMCMCMWLVISAILAAPPHVELDVGLTPPSQRPPTQMTHAMQLQTAGCGSVAEGGGRLRELLLLHQRLDGRA